MSEADVIFGRFPEFIKEYIFTHGWQELRHVQLAAAKVIFDTDANLLLTSATASGKTEAAFFPVLSDVYMNPPESVAVLYIAPLKSLINDQFSRMEGLLSEAGMPVFHWHGDVGLSHKEKMLKNPSGILQITPESLESMLINRSNDIPRLFGGLRYVYSCGCFLYADRSDRQKVCCRKTKTSDARKSFYDSRKRSYAHYEHSASCRNEL